MTSKPNATSEAVSPLLNPRSDHCTDLFLVATVTPSKVTIPLDH